MNINWPIAIIASLLVHAVILGALVATHTPADDDEGGLVEGPISGGTLGSGDPSLGIPSTGQEASPTSGKDSSVITSPGNLGPSTSPATSPATKDVAETERSSGGRGRPVSRGGRPEEASAGEAGTKEDAVAPEMYTIKAGDNLTMLAKKAGMTTTELAALNNKTVKELSRLYIGQTIRIK